jgi:5-bromo-4-chloroindolyl phosphate hydrolysis protein
LIKKNWTDLKNLDNVENQNKYLRENLDEANECIKKLKERLKKFI